MKSLGFTLLEVLIAMTLLSLIMILLFTGLTIGTNSWQKSEHKLFEINTIATTYQFLQNYLATALPLTHEQLKKTGDVNAPLAFQGYKQGIQFVSATRLGLQLFNLEKQKDVIKVKIKPFFFLSNRLKPDKEEVVLLTGVSDFTIHYFGMNQSFKTVWHKEWLKKTIQPQLVKISIKLDNGTVIPDWLIKLKTPEQDFALQAIPR